MQIILSHNHYDESHLAEVKAEMETMGAPKIKAVWMECYGAWVALEGCHRLLAAAALGLTPEIDEVEWSDETTTDDLGLDWQDTLTIEQICEDAYLRQMLTFED